MPGVHARPMQRHRPQHAGCRAAPAARTLRPARAAAARLGVAAPPRPTARRAAAARTGRLRIRQAPPSRCTSAAAARRCRRCAARSPVCSAAAHSASRRCSVASAAAATSASRRRQLRRRASSPSRAAAGAGARTISSPPPRTARPMTLRARTGSPPCNAASVTSAAGVSGVAPRVTLTGQRLSEPADRDRRTAGPACAAAPRPGCGRPGRRWSAARCPRIERCPRARRQSPAPSSTTAPAALTNASGCGPEPAEQVGGLAGVAVVDGDRRGDPHRRGAVGGVVGGQQVVGQPPGGRAVAGERQRVGEPGGRAWWRRRRRPRGTAVRRRFGCSADPRRWLPARRPGGRRAHRARPAAAQDQPTASTSPIVWSATLFRHRGDARRRRSARRRGALTSGTAGCATAPRGRCRAPGRRAVWRVLRPARPTPRRRPRRRDRGSARRSDSASSTGSSTARNRSISANWAACAIAIAGEPSAAACAQRGPHQERQPRCRVHQAADHLGGGRPDERGRGGAMEFVRAAARRARPAGSRARSRP